MCSAVLLRYLSGEGASWAGVLLPLTLRMPGGCGL